MKMYDKNGNYSIVTRVIFDANMKRLRNGENPLDIAYSMREQVALLEYNGPLLVDGIPTIRFWDILNHGYFFRRPLRIKTIEYAIPDWFNRNLARIAEQVAALPNQLL